MFPHKPNPLSRPEPPTPLPQFPRDLTALSLLISEKIREYATALLKKVDKVFTARSGDVAVFSAGGNIGDSGVQLSEVTETLAETVAKVPAAASASNQLADKAWVDDKVNSTSAYYITKNAAGEAFATPAELAAATEFYSGGELRTPTRNDYCLVLKDTDGTAWRYIYGASGWEPQYRIEGDYILEAVRAGTPVYNWSLDPSSVTVASSGAVLSLDRVRKFTENGVDYWGLYHSGITAPLGRAAYDTGDGDLTFTTNSDLRPGTVAASRDRLDKDIVGYLLGSQTDKPFPALVPDKNGNRTAMTIGSRDTSADIGRNTLTQGEGLQATSSNACARGLNSKATATGAIADGLATEATADYAHSEGAGTKARALAAHTEGHETRAEHEYEHAEGVYNKSNTDALFSIGVGTSSSDRKNAVEVHKNGKAYVKGLGGYDGTNPETGNDLATTVEGKAAKAANPTAGNLAALDAQGNPTNSGLVKNDVEDLFFARYYPDGSVKSAAEFTAGIKYGSFDTTNRTVSVLPFCISLEFEDDNTNLSGRVVIPPFVDAQGNPYISDDGTRFKVVGVSNGGAPHGYNTNLTTIIAPNTVTTIGDVAFQYCSSLITVSFPAATTIGGGAFQKCTSLTTVSLPAATTIETVALADCTSLTTVSLPAATTIESDALSDCTSLTSVSLPAATTIKNRAFSGCSSLESVDFGATPRSSVPTLGANAFLSVPTSCKIIVPDDQYDAWIAASGWSSLVTQGYQFLRHSKWEYAHNYEVDKKADKSTTYTKTEVDTKIGGFVDGATYNSTTKKILLKHGTATVAEIDATDFIKDGMVSSVEIMGGNLVITFNTDAGQEPITIPLTDIFNPANYYTKTQADTLLSGKLDKSGGMVTGPVLINSVNAAITGPLTLGFNVDPAHIENTVDIIRASNGDIYLRIYDTTLTDVVQLKLPRTSGTYALLSDINTAIQQIAPAWVSGAEYAKNKLCSYNGVVYQNTSGATIQSATTPDTSGSGWTAKPVSDLFLPLTGGTVTGALTVGPVPATAAELRAADPNGTTVLVLRENGNTLVLSGTKIWWQQYDWQTGVEVFFPSADGTLALLGNLAPEWVTSTQYAEGQMVNKDGKLYICATAHTSGTWTDDLAAGKWTANPTVQDAINAMDVSGRITGKLDSTSAAPAFSTSSTYAVDEHCTYNGKLYRCTTAVTTAGAWDASKWTADTMTDPDAVLDITAQNQLRVVAADGTVLWAQGYDLGTTSSATLSNEALNKYDFAVNATDAVTLTLPIPLSGKVGDFVLDITNPALDSTAESWATAFDSTATYTVGAVVSYSGKQYRCTTAVETAGEWTGSTNWEEALPYFTLSGLGTSFSVVVPVNENITDILTFAPGDKAELYFTQTAFTVNDLPAWKIVRQDVEAAS